MHVYCEKCNVLSSIQNRSRKRKSTVTAIHNFLCNVLRGFKSKENVCGIFLDLSKACDKDKYFLEKLIFYGMGRLANNWTISYLENRTQVASVP